MEKNIEILKWKNILVTGGAGFIGSHICDFLLKIGVGFIRILDNLSTGNKKNIENILELYPNVEFLYGDITNLEICRKACDGIDIICHQAALGSVPRSVNDPLASHNTNVNGFFNILMAAKENNIKRIVYASSSSVYGTNNNQIKLENEIGDQMSPYAVTKYIDEIYAKIFTNIYNMECIGLRYFNVFGPKQDPNGPYAAVIPKFIKQISEDKRPVINGDGTFTRDFTYIDNVIQANILAIITDNNLCFGQIYNVGTNNNISILEVFNTIKKILGKETIEPLFGPERVGDVPNSNANITKIKEMLEYNPTVTFEDGLQKTINFFNGTLETKESSPLEIKESSPLEIKESLIPLDIMEKKNKEKPIILISSTQYPGYGGAATNAYALIKSLRKYGYTTYGIFFENSNNNVDPDNIGNVIRLSYRDFDNKNVEKIDELKKFVRDVFVNDPTLILAKNYRAPYYSKLLYPDAKNIYLVSGIAHMTTFFTKISAQKFLSSKHTVPVYSPEIDSMEACDLAVLNSPLAQKIFIKIYPKYSDKIYPYPVDTTKEIASQIISKNINCDKEYDFIIVASVLTRACKNLFFLVKILKNRIFSEYSKIIVGDNNEMFQNIPNATLTGRLSHEETLYYIGKSRVLLFPSLIDANPNTVREACYLQCLPLISNNIGYYENFPQISICSTYNYLEWTSKMLNLANNYHNIINNYSINFDPSESINAFIEKISENI